ncbi:TatD family hydrolase [Endozoicomonas ascidiicola]|uniref:TatD family hydrolase n=1 Tax=Endozoicomonas ascidiicola TaxID=1698521 RepID=UPI000A44A4A2|nr:TatD family hydrolase [Endozoicomonas ascidiicola]
MQQDYREVALFDSHCHLNFPVFDQDREQVIERALAAGIGTICVPATRCAEWQPLLDLVEHINNTSTVRLVTALGLHPYFLAEHHNDHLVHLDEWLQKKPDSVVAIGETGLDFYDQKHSEANAKKQIELFTAHVQLASQHQLPLIIHGRKSHDQILKILRYHQPTQGGIIHAFSGSEQQAKIYIDLGFKIGFGGGITYPRASKTRHLAATLPLDSIVLETDAPDMPLNGFQGERNEPARIQKVAGVLAVLRGLSLKEVTAATSSNCYEVFKL